MQHTTSAHGSPLYDLTAEQTYPPDVYTHPHLYDDRSEHGRLAHEVIVAVRHRPDALVRIFRAVPVGVEVINPGDWVALTEGYARQHAINNDNPADDDPVITATVRADQLRTGAEALYEWGYFGPALTAQTLPAASADSTESE